MATTNFIDRVTPINASWLNDVDAATYEGAGVFTSAGTGAVARTVQAKLRETVSVKDYGATGDGTTDDTAAIQAAIDANAGRVIMLPVGTYLVAGTLSITADGTVLCGVPSGRGGYSPSTGSFGSTILQTTANVDTVVFQPASSATERLRGVEIRDICIRHTTTLVDTNPTSGIGLRIRRAHTYRVDGVTVIDAYEPVVIQGGSDGKINNLGIHTYYGTPVAAETAMLSFKSDLWNGTTFQPCYTVEVSNLYINGTKMRQHAVWVASADGLHFTNAYIAGAAESLLRLRNVYDGGAVASSDTVAALSLVNCYLDCVTATPTASLGTKHAIKIEEDGNTNTRIYHLDVGSGCFLGNTDNSLVNATFTKAAGQLSFTGAHFANAASGISLTGGGVATDLYISGCRLTSITAASGVIDVSGVRELTMSGTSFLPTAGPCLDMTGTMGRVTITGCDNNSTQNDMVSTATVTSLTLAGNNSASSNAAKTWRGLRTANQSSDDVRVLDHYLEGTFTPTLTFGGASVGITYTTQYGAYTRIGNRVMFEVAILLSSKGSSTGDLVINGLPIVNAATSSTPVSVAIDYITAGVADQFVQGFVFAGSTGCGVFKYAAGATVRTQLTDADVGATLNVRITGHYIA